MNTLPFSTKTSTIPPPFDDLFDPWDEWFENESQVSRIMRIPAVNITEQEDAYQISFAVPGFKKEDFNVGVTGNILTIGSNKEETVEEKEKKFARREYSYTSFSRSFTLPDEINIDKIEAKYEDGILKLTLPRKESRNVSAKQIAVG